MDDEQHGPGAEAERRPQRRSWSRVRWGISIAATLLVVCVGGVFAGNRYVAARGDAHLQRQLADDRAQTTVGSWADAQKALDAHAAALLRGDERGWLAAVDPQLHDHYRRLFTTLRALGVTAWSYHVRTPPPTAWGRSDLRTDVTVAYCLHVPACPAFDIHHVPGASETHSPNDSVPLLRQKVSMAHSADGAYVITALEPVAEQVPQQPKPWETTRLTFAQGERVTVAAAPGQQHRLRQAVVAADRAAAVTDRYAAYVDNPQPRYRVYLAGDQEWKTWHGESPPAYAAGYAVAVGQVGTDIVVKMSVVRDDELFEILRHEGGHAVTVGGTDRRADAWYDGDQWLIEGVAEYIEHAPEPPTGSGRRAVLQRAGTLPGSVLLPPLTDESTHTQVSEFYTFSHFAVSCMARRFGEAKLFDFVRKVLREGASVDAASQAAYGRSFADVDRSCVSDIRRDIG